MGEAGSNMRKRRLLEKIACELAPKRHLFDSGVVLGVRMRRRQKNGYLFFF